MRKGIIPGKTRAQIKAEQEEKKDKKPTLLQKSSLAKRLFLILTCSI